MNWYILIPFIVLAILLISFLIKRNQKDEKDFEQQENYINTKEEVNDIISGEELH